MAITTLDAAIAGAKPPEAYLKATGTMEAAGIHHSNWRSVGFPPQAALPASGLNGEALSSPVSGQIPVPAASGNTHLYRLTCVAAVAGTLILADRLWQNSGIVVTTTTAQAITPVAIPARDADGSTNGRGVYAAIELTGTTTNASAITNMTISYTDSGGTAGNTGAITNLRTGGGFPATGQLQTFVPFDLATGDQGVRSVQSITLGTSLGAGSASLVLYRPLASVSVPAAGVMGAVDFITSGGPRVYDNSVPFLIWFPSATTTTNITGEVQFTQG